MQRFAIHLFSLSLLFSFTACDSGSDGDGNGDGNAIGSASVTVSGGFSDSFSGSAAFGVDDDGSGFSLALFEGGLPTSGTFSGAVVALGRDGDRPAEGTYPINTNASAGTFAGGYASNFSSIGSGIFVGTMSGTLTITSSSSDRVAGSFTFTGQGISGTGGALGEATVEGTFSADFASNIPSGSFP